MKEIITKCDGCWTVDKVEPFKMWCYTDQGYAWVNKDWCFKCFKNYVLGSKKPISLLESIERA